MLYNPPTGSPAATSPFIGKNVAAGILGSKLPPGAAEYPQREIVNAEMAAGLSPSNGDMTQLAQAMSIGLWLGAMGGSANAISDTLPVLATSGDGLTPYAIPALLPGMTFHGIIPATNTGPATLTLTGFGTAPGQKAIVRKDGTPLQPGDLVGGAIASWRFDGTSFRVVGMVTSDVTSVVFSVIASNFIISTAITIQIGGVAPAAPASGYPNYFPTLTAAQNWLSQYRISSLGSVLLQFPGGSTGNNKIAINTSIAFTHPDGARITIAGATPPGTAPNSAALQMTGNSAAQRASDNAANLATCRAWLATELFLTNGSTISFGSQINVQNILFNSDGSKNANGQPVDLVDFYGGGVSNLSMCAFFNASHYGFAASGATVFTGGTIVASGCSAENVVAVGNGTIAPQGPVYSYSSAACGFKALTGGLIYSTPNGTAPCYARGNASYGFYAFLGTIDLGEGSVPSYADYNNFGYFAYEGSKIYSSGCEASTTLRTAGAPSAEPGSRLATPRARATAPASTLPWSPGSRAPARPPPARRRPALPWARSATTIASSAEV